MPGTAARFPVSRLVNGERLVVLGWGRAILMQFAHPLVAAGVHDHSTFRSSRRARLVRLHETIRAMLGLTFGDEDAAARVAARINAIHDRVRGTLREAAGTMPAGTPYSARDPELLAWVHVTLLDSLPLAYSLLVRPLAVREADSYCVEAAAGAARLGLSGPRVPLSAAAARAAVERALSDGRLAASGAARSLARDVLAPPGRRLLGPVSGLYRLVTVGTLPPAVRVLYDLPWTDRDERRLRACAARVRWLRARTPDRLARWRAATRSDSDPPTG